VKSKVICEICVAQAQRSDRIVESFLNLGRVR